MTKNEESERMDSQKCRKIAQSAVEVLKNCADKKEPLLDKIPTLAAIVDSLKDISDEFKRNREIEKATKEAIESAKTTTKDILAEINPVEEDEGGDKRIIAGKSVETRSGFIDQMAVRDRKILSTCSMGWQSLREDVKSLRKRYDRAVADYDRRRDPRNPQTYIDLGNAKASLATVDRYLRLV